ncbi:hypothetical protein B4064_1531 [Caldibacillus thermoamylovorans]|nr:hypothetical protein B4064_1531 [Caldibacillus thermoamylovorans]
MNAFETIFRKTVFHGVNESNFDIFMKIAVFNQEPVYIHFNLI